MTGWMTAPAGLYTFDAATGMAVPILAVDADGFGLMPGGRTTKQIYMVGAPKGDPKDPDRHRDRMSSVQPAATSIEGHDRIVAQLETLTRILADHVSGVAPQPDWMIEGVARDYRDYRDRHQAILEEWRHVYRGRP